MAKLKLPAHTMQAGISGGYSQSPTSVRITPAPKSTQANSNYGGAVESNAGEESNKVATALASPHLPLDPRERDSADEVALQAKERGDHGK